MAWREWTEREAEKLCKKHQYFSEPAIALAFKTEHARAVRIVKQVVKHAAHMEQQTRVNREANAYWQGKLDGAENILAALTKRRA